MFVTFQEKNNKIEQRGKKQELLTGGITVEMTKWMKYTELISVTNTLPGRDYGDKDLRNDCLTTICAEGREMEREREGENKRNSLESNEVEDGHFLHFDYQCRP